MLELESEDGGGLKSWRLKVEVESGMLTSLLHLDLPPPTKKRVNLHAPPPTPTSNYEISSKQ